MKKMAYPALVAILAAASTAIVAVPAAAQDFELSVANIMRGPEHVGSAPSFVRWTDDGEWIYFRWLPGGQPWHEEPEMYRVPARGGSPEMVSDEHMDSVGVYLSGGDYSEDRRWKVVSHDGDLWEIDRRRDRARQLTDT